MRGETLSFDINRLNKEIAEYAVEIERFKSLGNEEAASVVSGWKASLERKIDVIKGLACSQ